MNGRNRWVGVIALIVIIVGAIVLIGEVDEGPIEEAAEELDDAADEIDDEL